MKKIIIPFFLALSTVFLTGCQVAKQEVALPLDIQATQKRDFETSKKIAFASAISVFQDLGYIIGNADFETGLITANSPTSNTTSGALIVLSALAGSIANASGSTTKVSAFIEEIVEGRVSIRLNFVVNSTTSSAYGQNTSTDKPILDKKVYIEAFNKIENAIFVRS